MSENQPSCARASEDQESMFSLAVALRWSSGGHRRGLSGAIMANSPQAPLFGTNKGLTDQFPL